MQERLTQTGRRLALARSWLPALALSALLVFGALRTLPDARESLQTSKPYHLYAGASAWLEANTPLGERVFQTDWDDFPRLFFYNIHNTYLIGLDPTYLQLYDAQRYDRWLQITQGKVDDPANLIQADFGARYVISDLHHEDFIRQAEGDPAMDEVYRDDQAVIYAIR